MRNQSDNFWWKYPECRSTWEIPKLIYSSIVSWISIKCFTYVFEWVFEVIEGAASKQYHELLIHLYLPRDNKQLTKKVTSFFFKFGSVWILLVLLRVKNEKPDFPSYCKNLISSNVVPKSFTQFHSIPWTRFRKAVMQASLYSGYVKTSSFLKLSFAFNCLAKNAEVNSIPRRLHLITPVSYVS